MAVDDVDALFPFGPKRSAESPAGRPDAKSPPARGPVDQTEPMPEPEIGWRQPFTSAEANRLHAAAFDTRLYTDEEWDWVDQVERNSLGWVTARLGGELVGFTNVVTDGFVHAWLQDVMVDPDHQRRGIGARLVEEATGQSRGAGCEWLHVDFDDDVADFYYRRCGFERTNGGILPLR